MCERVPVFFSSKYSVIDGFLQDGSIEDPPYDELEQAKAERDDIATIRKVYFHP